MAPNNHAATHLHQFNPAFELPRFFKRWDLDMEEPVSAADFEGHGIDRAIMLEAHAIKMRAKKMTYHEIAAELGVGYDTARSTVKRGLARVLQGHGSEVIRAEELATIDIIMARLWPALDPIDPDAIPNLRAVETFLKLSKARRELTGADAPVKVHVKGEVAVTHNDGSAQADKVADAVNRFAELANRLIEAGYKDIVDAEVVDEKVDHSEANPQQALMPVLKD